MPLSIKGRIADLERRRVAHTGLLMRRSKLERDAAVAFALRDPDGEVRMLTHIERQGGDKRQQWAAVEAAFRADCLK